MAATSRVKSFFKTGVLSLPKVRYSPRKPLFAARPTSKLVYTVPKGEMEKHVQDNRANQLNPNKKEAGPGRPAAYTGFGDKADLDNHAQQLNPNNEKYQPKK